MIRIWRGEEPGELRDLRDVALAKAELHYGESAQCPAVDRFQIARKQLYEAQHRKCAWCERAGCDEGQPVEHYRPKGGASRCWPGCSSDARLAECIHPGCERTGDDLRYFWLGWTWENLLFACVSCNSPSVKGNHFPLDPSSEALPILEPDVTKETHWLVDPARDNPRDHVRFRLDQELDRWVAHPLTSKGRWTLAVLGLNRRDSISSLFASHVGFLDGIREELEGHLAAGERERLRHCWERWLRRLFDPRKSFHSLSFDYLEHHFPAEFRREWGLRSPPDPGDLREPLASNDRPHPELEGVSRTMQLRIRALGRHAKKPDLYNVIWELCEGDGCEVSELAVRLPRSERYLRRVLAEMVELDELELDGER